ncbi:DEAD-box ATP-dependent RNA helicase 10-like [Rosa rugosa]|uniref:DEAD-box ATP-dependent RNA helicase 10-like n=1 Tax=Rosa rugosa TaxID=74645 RepID=UPI002B416376|nr:DEAD-box ATP-dependent RNA helicase 10-like [Rosa rugosa]
MGSELEEKTRSFKSLGLCDKLVKAVGELQWKAPTPIQAETIPHALAGKHLIALAQTGSGKTGAFALPILQALMDSPQKAFFALVLSPTRELAVQIRDQFEALGVSIGAKSAVLIGGLNMVEESKVLARRPHIIVATPGRLLHHLRDTKGFSLRTVKYLVLDEADRLLGDEFQKSTDEILKSLPRGDERITYLFSATMTKKVKKVERACLRNPVKIEVASKYSTVDTLKQHVLMAPFKHKDCYLVYILTKKCQCTTMVFTEQCATTPFLAYTLRNLGIRAIPLHGDMSQQKRLGALNMFKSGQCNVLVCTDVASRGLDIPSVDMVINYDIPKNTKNYIHRVGRTARAGRSGVAITFVGSILDLPGYSQIESLIGNKLPLFPAPSEEALQFLESVREARRLATSKMKESGGKKRKWGGNDDEEDIVKYLSNQAGTSKKKFNKRFKK